ncbi:hypothetical protein Tco_1045480 [Tanacetum coccineum]|uniref:Uncharacterized protein n=1 Tax=Tanacetum coccineum TaxID=301880 RepID=A0ABQ5GT00_9ASTR
MGLTIAHRKFMVTSDHCALIFRGTVWLFWQDTLTYVGQYHTIGIRAQVSYINIDHSDFRVLSDFSFTPLSVNTDLTVQGSRVHSSVTSSGDETSSGIVSDEEIEKKELEAHYGFMAKIQEVLPAESSLLYALELKDDSNVIPDSSNICTNDNQVDQNAAECVDERAALANLTLDTEENKTVLKQLKKANASLTQELKECKTNLDETSRALGEATSSRDSCLIALQTKQTELEKYTALNDRKTSDLNTSNESLNENSRTISS